MSDKVFRNPAWSAGPEIYMAYEMTDQIDWGQKAIGLEEIFKTSKGEGVRVAVLDTGRPTHRDVAEAITRPKNFTNSNTDVDKQGHSTHVCGTLGARENAFGVIGGAPRCEIVPVKVLNDAGEGIGTWVAAGIDYACANGCDIISMSLGGGVDLNITNAIRRAHNAGKLIICAAGNEGADPTGRSRVGSPGSMAEVAAVAAYGPQGDIAPFSSQGPEVDTTFPGVEIMSCWLQDQYRRLSGTSMATPLCSAVMACRLSYQRQLEREGKPVAEMLRNNADMLKSIHKHSIDKGPPGDDPAWGWGILDCVPFVNAASGSTPTTPPVPPVTTTTLPPVAGQPTTTPPPTTLQPIAYTVTFFGKRVIVLDNVAYGGRTGTFLYPE